MATRSVHGTEFDSATYQFEMAHPLALSLGTGGTFAGSLLLTNFDEVKR